MVKSTRMLLAVCHLFINSVFRETILEVRIIEAEDQEVNFKAQKNAIQIT